MLTLNEKIAESKAKAEQLKRHKRLQDNREKKQKQKEDTRRKIVVGEIVLKYFPEILQFQPYLSEAKNNIEFAEFEIFVSELACDKAYIIQQKEKIKYKNILK